MAERHVGHEHARAAARDERPASAGDQLLEEPGGERRTHARMHDGQAPSVELQLVDRVAPDLGDHVVDHPAAVLIDHLGDHVLEEAQDHVRAGHRSAR